MHMADALLSPSVGLGFCAVSAAAVGHAASRLDRSLEERHVPLMGVLGAFVFAAQMVNFTIPGTGSSGHLIGGVLLSVLLGGQAALITMTSVLIVQSLFFADGGILALGANIFNMGVYPCLLGGSMVRMLSGQRPGPARSAAAIIAAAVVCLELGAASVAAQTVLSGRSELSFTRFAGLMMAIHLPIGLGEGVLTWMAIGLIRRLYAQTLAYLGPTTWDIDGRYVASPARLLVALAVAAAALAGLVSWFASSRPDGLEWSLAKVTSKWESSQAPVKTGLPEASAQLQQRFAPMAGYRMGAGGAPPAGAWPAVDASRSLAGLLGGLVSLGLAGGIGATVFLARKRRRKLRGGQP